MTATSSDAESLRERRKAWLDGYTKGVRDAAQPVSSDLRAAMERLATASRNFMIVRVRYVNQTGGQSTTNADMDAATEALLRETEAAFTVLDTAQPDLRRTSEAEIDVERLARALASRWEYAGFHPLSDAKGIAEDYAKLAATPAALDPIAYFKEQLPDALDAMAEDQAKYDALPLPKPALVTKSRDG